MRRILIVDDDSLVRRVFTLWSERAGFIVTTAANGIEACNLAAGVAFDGIVMDINMPHVTGIETCRRILKNNGLPRAPYIWLMTGMWTPDVEREGLAVGARAVLAKPFSGEFLIELLEAAWAERDAERLA